MVSKASEDLPDPLTPVTIISFPTGRVTSMSLRLWVRAPRTTRSPISAAPVGTVSGMLGTTLGPALRSRPIGKQRTARQSDLLQRVAGRRQPDHAYQKNDG